MSVFRRHVVLSVVVSAALVVGFVSPAVASTPASASAGVTTVPGPPTPPVPGAGVPASDLRVQPPRGPAVKFQTPSGKSDFNPSTSTPISYGTDDTLFRNSDGSETKEVSPTPLNVQQPNGSWVSANTTVTATSDGAGGFQVANNPLKPHFARSLGSGADVSVDSGTDPVSISLVGAASVTAVQPSATVLHAAQEGLGSDQAAAGSAVEYPNAFPGEDLQYQVTTSEVKETLVLNSVPDASQTSWSWDVHAPGLTMSQGDMGALNLTDASGVVQYNIPDPIMWDSSGVEGQSQSEIADVPFTFAQQANGDWLITVTPDRAWLTDPSRVFPVSIDPTVGEGGQNLEAFKSDGTKVSGVTYVGNPNQSTTVYWRTVACYNYQAVFGNELTGASVGASYVTGNKASTSYPGGFYQATAFAYSGGNPTYLSSFTLNPNGTAGDSGLVTEFRNLVNAQSAGTCFLITGDEVPHTYTYRGINTTLYLNYEAAPSASLVSPGNGALTNLSPVLSVSATDPSGAAQNYAYQVSTNPNPGAAVMWGGGWTGSTSVQIPPGVLASGTTYYWDVSVLDEYGAQRYSPVQSFTTYRPSVAAAPSLSPTTTVGGGLYTRSTTPTFTSSAADANGGSTAVVFEVDSNTSGSAVTSCGTGYAAQGSSVSCTAGALTSGVTYYVRALGTDGSQSSPAWSGYTAFTVESAAPPVATFSCPAPYGEDSWTDAVPSAPVSCTVTVAAPAAGQSPSYQLQVAVDGGTPTTTSVSIGSAGSTTVSVPAASGGHTISAVTVAPSGVTAQGLYSFGLGGAAVSSPLSGTKTNDVIRVTAAAPPRGGATGVTAQLKWRPANTGTSNWNTVTTGVPVVDQGSAGVAVNNYAWSTASATTDTTTGSSVSLNPRLPALLEVEVCFTYTFADTSTSTKCTAVTGGPVTVLRVPHAFGDGFPVETVGDGQVALWTGELQVSATDVSVSTPAGALSVSRTHSSFAGPQDPETQVFGPGWSASFAGEGLGATGDQVVDGTSTYGTISLIDASDNTETFAVPAGATGSAPAGTYTPVDTATTETGAQLTVAGTGSSRVLKYTTLDGTVTTWAPVSGSSVPIQWAPVSVVQAGSQGTETYSTDSQGRVTQILAPLPAGVTSCTPSGPSGLLQPGCSALQISYATATTATSTSPGDYSGQVSSITYETYDPAASAMTVSTMATYKYDTSGHLVSVTHPLTSSTPAVTYTYTSAPGDTLLASTATPGHATTTYNYSAATGDERLQNVTLGGATTGAASSIQSSFVYNITPTTTGLPDFTAGTMAKWGQTDAPTAGYAVFGADHPVDTDNAATLIGESGWSAAQWQYAALDYTDSNGYQVNTASYGAGEWLRTETSYDAKGNAAGSLDPVDIDTAVASNLGSSALADQSVTRYNGANPTINGVATTVAAETYVTDTWSAPFYADLAGNGTQTLVRTHTHYDYDQGAPNGDVNPATSSTTPTPYLLQTAVTVGVATVGSATTDPTVTLPADLQTTSVTNYGYNPIDGSSATGPTSGWTLGKATVTTTVMPGSGNNIVKKVLYNSAGAVTQSVAPLSTGSDAGTTLTVTYTAGTNPTNAACGNQPQWAGLTCWTGPAAAPTSGPGIVATQVMGYSKWFAPTQTGETSGSANRTTTTTYLADGRQDTTTVATTGLPGSTPVPTTKVLYDPTTFQQTGTAILTGSGSIASSDTTTSDLWGRVTAYTDSIGDTTTTTYVAPGSQGAGQVATVTTPSGPSSTVTSTYTYNGTDANGNAEHRDLATGLSISGLGSFTAAYDKDGNLVTQNMPAGLSQAWTYNPQDQLTSLTYSGDVTTTGSGGTSTTATGSWLSYNRDYDAAGRVAREWTPVAGTGLLTNGYSNVYSYDQADRLTNFAATSTNAGAVTGCVDRQYAFDQQGNRTSLNTATGTTSCPTAGTGTATTYAYDTFSRQLSGANGAGTYVYDVFGRQTTIPAADAPNPSNGAITLSYFDTDAVQSIVQGTVTTTFILDPDGRRSTETVVNSATGTSTTTTDHYANASDSPNYASETGSTTQSSVYLATLSAVGAVATTSGSGSGSTSTTSLDFSDLDGSTSATVTLPASGHATTIASLGMADEYGNSVGSTPTTGTLQYGWHGTAQREISGAGLTLMGCRVYNPTTARFTSTDPVAGGNDNAYNYPDDPINGKDLTGEKASKANPAKTVCVGMRHPVCGVTAGNSPSVVNRLGTSNYTMAQGNRDALTFASGAAWVSTVAGVASYATPLAIVAKPVSILAGGVSTAIYCTHGQTVDCEIGGIATATGVGGSLAKSILSVPILGISDGARDAPEQLGNLVATWWNAAGLLHG